MDAAQALAGASNVVNVLEFRLRNPEAAPGIAREIERQAGMGFATSTWIEQQRALFRALRLEKTRHRHFYRVDYSGSRSQYSGSSLHDCN